MTRHGRALAFATLFAAVPAPAQISAPARCGVGIPAAEQTGYVPLPRGDVFCPLVADPKASRSFVSLLRHESGEDLLDEKLDIELTPGRRVPAA
jgi:hypothetical protein